LVDFAQWRIATNGIDGTSPTTAPSQASVAESSVTLPPEKKERVMPEYRIYTLTEGNKITGPWRGVTCDDDEKAIQQAKRWLDGHDLEVWEGSRRVSRLARTGARSAGVLFFFCVH
jgi:hypothetical protein